MFSIGLSSTSAPLDRCMDVGRPSELNDIFKRD